MSDVSYRPLVEDMTWSYSRINTFHQCPYRWFLKYIRGLDETPQFYASYGKFIHKLLEEFYNGELSKDDMKMRFLVGFSDEVQGRRPSEKIVFSYIDKGISYLDSFEAFPYNMVDVEMKFEIDFDGVPLIGFIDYLGELDGEYYIIDNKSRDLKPRSNRKTPTKKDEELDEMLKQLYVYSAAVREKYGKYPKKLCFNCFKNGVFIEEPFVAEKYNETLLWVMKSIEDIKNASEDGSFPPNMEFFNCLYLCGYTDECEYWQMRGDI